MRVTHLLDTDVAIEILRGRDAAVRSRLQEADRGLAVSAVTVMELAYGASRSSDPGRNSKAVDAFLGLVGVEDFDTEAASHAGEIRAELAADGEPIGAYDVLIAGHARSRGLVVVTRNVREFARVPGLRVEVW